MRVILFIQHNPNIIHYNLLHHLKYLHILHNFQFHLIPYSHHIQFQFYYFSNLNLNQLICFHFILIIILIPNFQYHYLLNSISNQPIYSYSSNTNILNQHHLFFYYSNQHPLFFHLLQITNSLLLIYLQTRK